MEKVEHVEVEYIKKTTAILIAVICLAAGFAMGILYTNLDSNRDKNTSVQSVPAPQQSAQQPPQSSTTQQINNMNLIAQLEKAVLTDPKNTEAWAQLGHVYFDSNQYTRAIEAYKKYLELKPDNADIQTDLGVMYHRQGKPMEALRSFDKAVEITPGHQQSRFNKGIVLLYDMKNSDAAIKVWQELLDINPSATAPNGQPISELIKELTTKTPK